MAKHKKSAIVSALLGLLLITSASLVMAQPPGRGGPPPEAIEACDNAAEGDACSFEGRRGDVISGACVVPPRGEASLLCMPEGGPPGGGPGRPE